MARPRALDAAAEKQLARLIAAGVSQTVAARALNVSRRTIVRYSSRDRVEPQPQSLGELLEALELGRQADGVP